MSLFLHQHGASYSRREATDNHRRRMPVDKEFVANWGAQLKDDDYVQRLNDMFEERWCQSSADFDVLIAQLQEIREMDRAELRAELRALKALHADRGSNTFLKRP